MMSLLPIHPLLIAVAFVLHNVVETAVHPLAAGRALLIAVVFPLLIQLIASGTLRERHRGAVVATAFVTLTVLWGPISSVAAGVLRLSTWQVGVLGILAAAAGLLGYRVLRRRAAANRPSSVTQLLNTFGVMLIGLVLVNLLWSPLLGRIPLDLAGPRSGHNDPVTGAPDIFIVIADGHPRADSLVEQTGKDIAPFLGALGDRGFSVSADSHANYSWTSASLTSMFHMQHLKQLQVGAELLNEDRPGDLSARNALSENAAFDLLRSKGYEIVAIGPPHEHAALRSADRFVDVGYLNGFECHLLRGTLAGTVLWGISPSIMGNIQREAVERSLRQMAAIAGESGRPRFVIVHLPVPHLPVLWDEAGRPVDDPNGSYCAPQEARRMSRDELVSAFVQQFDHLHSLLLTGIDQVLATARTDPVIVLMSDHGGKIGNLEGDAERWRDRYATLFAARTPGGDIFGETVSLVNVLPTLFREYLGEASPLRADTTFQRDGDTFVPVLPARTEGD
jgi:hypothetical protein